MNKIKVLLAEDEETLAMIVKESLETRSFEISVAHNGVEALHTYLNHKFDILVLDIMMPEKDGLSLAKEIRKTDKHIPIIFLTAKSQVQDVVEGFQSGANDYLKKPFSMEELIVRIQALVRRINPVTEMKIQNIGKYSFDYTKQFLKVENEVFSLTHREAELLQMLLNNKNEIVERSIILTKIWGKDDFFNGRSMDVFITKLRKKLSQDESIQIINIRGQGYKIIF